MYLKICLYIITETLSIYALDSININNVFKKNKIFQARLLYLFVSFALSYLVTNFIYDFVMNCNLI